MAEQETVAHTATPWAYFEQKHWGQQETYGCVRGPAGSGGMKNGVVIVNGCAPGHTAEADANARFIVRACNAHDELLAALKNLVGQSTYCYMPDPAAKLFAPDAAARSLAGRVSGLRPYVQDAHAAIAQAE